MHQQRFAWLQPAALEDVVPDGKEGLRNGGRFRKGGAGRQRQGIGGMDGHIFRVTAAIRQRAHLVADPPALRGSADGDNDA